MPVRGVDDLHRMRAIDRYLFPEVFAIEIFPVSFVATEPRELMQGMGLFIDKAVGNKFHLAYFVRFPPFGSVDDGEKFPVDGVDGIFEFLSERGCAFVRMGGLDEIIHQSKKVSAVS